MADLTAQDTQLFDQVAPRYMIIVEGKELGSDITDRISSLEVDLDIDQSDEISVVVDDHDRAMSESKALAEGNLIHVYMGYGMDLHHMSTGQITSWLPDYPRDSLPTLQVKALDILHKSMDTAKHNGGFRKQKDSEIAKHIMTDHMKLQADTDLTEGIRARLQKKGVSDYAFVKRLALLNNYYFWVDYDVDKERWTGHWREKGKVHSDQEVMYSFIYNNDLAVSLLEFKPEFNSRGQTTEVEVVSYDKKTKKTIKQVVKEEKKGPDTKFTDVEPIEDEIVSGASVVFTAFGQRMEVISSKPFKSSKMAQKWAERYLKSRSDNFLTGDGVVVGTPDLRPRQIHYLGGMGARFNGQWELTHTRHAMGPDMAYETTIKARKIHDPSNPNSGVADVPLVARLATARL